MIFSVGLILILFSIFLSMAFGVGYRTIQLANMFWIFAVVATLYFLVQILFSNLFSKVIELFAKTLYTITPLKLKEIYIIITILIISFIAGFSETYYLGGDDTKLFYLYPAEYLKNYASSISPSNSVSAMVGFLPSRSVYYFAGFLAVLKTLLPFLNLQATLYTLNILFGLYIFYKLVDYIVGEKQKYSNWIYLLSAFVYVFSIFNIYILFNARLIAIYLISLFPLSIYLFIKSIKENKFFYVVMISILWSVFCFVSVVSLWFLASIIVIFPLILFLIKDHTLRALKYSLLLGAILLLINLHWIYLVPYSTLANKSGISVNNIGSEEFLKASSEGLISNAEINEFFYPLNNLFHYQIQNNFKWPYFPVFEKWYLKLIPFSTLYIVIIVLAGLLKRKGNLGRFHTISLITLLVSFYFFTVNLGKTSLGNWGISLFVFLNESIPGFVAFRNMYDKFAYVLSFTFALALALSLAVLSKRFSRLILRRILICLMVVSTLMALPFLIGRFRNLPIWKTSDSFHTTTQLNEDYLVMMEYMRDTKDEGRYLTLPLSRGNIAFIQDQKVPNHYYIGVSPSLILSGKNDYSGSLSFGVFENEFTESLLKGDYNSLGALLRKTNTKYVIANNTISPDLQNSYLLGDGLYGLQGQKFLNTILGPKVKDFGLRYSIYNIHPDLENSKIFYESGDATPAYVEFNKVSDIEYSVRVNNLNNGKLVLLEQFMAGWDIYEDDGKTKIEVENKKYDDWANSWTISSESVAFGDGEVGLRIIFSPFRNMKIFNFISLLSLFSATGYVIYYGLYKKNEKNN